MTISEMPAETRAVDFEEYYCRECNIFVAEKDTRFVSRVRTAMLTHKLCHYCHHWTALMEYSGPCASVRVEGRMYMFDTRLPYVANPIGSLGHQGQMFVIKFLLTGEEMITNNLWFQGVIPERFRHRLPDNAEFIPYEERRGA